MQNFEDRKARLPSLVVGGFRLRLLEYPRNPALASRRIALNLSTGNEMFLFIGTAISARLLFTAEAVRSAAEEILPIRRSVLVRNVRRRLREGGKRYGRKYAVMQQ